MTHFFSIHRFTDSPIFRFDERRSVFNEKADPYVEVVRSDQEAIDFNTDFTNLKKRVNDMSPQEKFDELSRIYEKYDAVFLHHLSPLYAMNWVKELESDSDKADAYKQMAFVRYKYAFSVDNNSKINILDGIDRFTERMNKYDKKGKYKEWGKNLLNARNEVLSAIKLQDKLKEEIQINHNLDGLKGLEEIGYTLKIHPKTKKIHINFLGTGGKYVPLTTGDIITKTYKKDDSYILEGKDRNGQYKIKLSPDGIYFNNQLATDSSEIKLLRENQTRLLNDQLKTGNPSDFDITISQNATFAEFRRKEKLHGPQSKGIKAAVLDKDSADITFSESVSKFWWDNEGTLHWEGIPDNFDSNNPDAIEGGEFRFSPDGTRIYHQCKGSGIGREFQTIDLNGAKVQAFQAKKPIIYLYPEKETNINVDVSVSEGHISVEYPKRKGNSWDIQAFPDGRIIDNTSDKEYSYLFWEAEKPTPFPLNVEKSFCISRENAEEFLEEKLEILGLRGKEKHDFIVYWLPFLEKNEHSIIQFLEEEYTEYAPLSITPSPETLIRIFMIFQESDEIIETGNPELKKRERIGYTAVEWGGSNLDEGKQKNVYFAL